MLDDEDATAGTPVLWHVALTVSGPAVCIEELRCALDRLVQQRPFMVSVRYAVDRVELRYWDEAEDVDDVAALALRLWGEHRASAGLPDWTVVGLEVLTQAAMQGRGADRAPSLLVAAGVGLL